MYDRQPRGSSPRSGREAPIEFEEFGLFNEGTSAGTLDLRKLLALVWRGKVFLALCLLIGLAAGGLLISRQEPVYVAVATILYEPERMQIVDMTNLVAESDPSSGVGNQLEILNSTSLLERVVRSLGIDSFVNEEFALPESGEPASDAGDIGPAPPAEGAAVADAPESEETIASPQEIETSDAATKMRRAVDVLRDNMRVRHINGSGVIEVAYSSSQPESAERIANSISEEYIALQQASKNQDALIVIELIDRRIEELKRRVAESESALEEARLDLAERQSQSAEMTTIQLSALNQELASIRLLYAESLARYDRAATALEDDQELWSVTEFRNSDLILEFRRHEIEVRSNVARESAITGDVVTPSLSRSQALLKDIAKGIREEAGYIVAALEFEVTSLAQREAQLVKMIRELEVTSIEQIADELAIDRLEREVQANQNLLQTFVSRQREITEQSQLQSADARILSRADTPLTPDYESSARTMIATAGSGLLLGFIWLLGREQISNSVRDPNDLAEITSLPVIASIPIVGSRKNLHKLGKGFLSRPQSLLAESVRNLRTSILYGDPNLEPKVVMFTSSVPKEGKSSLSFLTALASQSTGRKTILVSCDLRDDSNANLYSKFPSLSGKSHRSGLATYFRNECDLEEVLATEESTGLHILALSKSEILGESPADILSSARFVDMVKELRNKYELVILDTPPALVVTDARLLARLSDTVVYLVHWNHTHKNAVREGLRELRSLGAHISGCVFTLVSQTQARKYADNEFIYKRGYAGYYR